MWELYNSGFILWERQEDVFERKVNVQAKMKRKMMKERLGIDIQEV